MESVEGKGRGNYPHTEEQMMKIRENSPMAGLGSDTYNLTEDEKKAELKKKDMNRKILMEILNVTGKEIVKTDEEAEERIGKYFVYCAENGIKPTVEELALALGTTRKTLWDWENGNQGAISSNVIKKAKEILASFDAKMVLENRMNPVLYFFRAKNYYGMKDTMDYVLTPNTPTEDRPEKLIQDAAELPD